MSYPYDASDLAAIVRLGSYYNGLAYDAGSNPGGMAAGGHRTNLIPSLQDVALIADAIADAAAAAAASAVSTAADVVTTAANAAKLAGTSTSSVAIGTGSKSFTTQASKFFNVGTHVLIVSDANPTVNFMGGPVTAYSGTALTVNVTVIGGSGTKTDWSLYTSGAPGVTGSTGAAGAQGETPSLKWTFGNGITDTDPGNGIFVINNATYSGATFLYFDNLDSSGTTATTFLDALDDSTTTANRGTIFLQQVGTAATYAMFSVTGAVIDGTGYRKVPVSHIMSGGAFSNGIPVAVTFQRTGNSGADGGGAGDTISDISSGTDGRVVVFSGTSGKHINQASYGIGTSGANIGALSTANTWGATQAFAAITVAGAATFSNAANEAHGADIASASTINLDTATGNLVDVTGTTTITAITLSEGRERTVRFTGVLTLTHGSSLILPGAANITTAAGDFAIVRGYAAGIVRCVNYSRAAIPPRYDALQTVINSFGGLQSGLTATVPYDNTIPQKTEGDEIATQAITPIGASNILEITAQVVYSTSTANGMAMFLCQDDTADCLVTSFELQSASGNMTMIRLFWRMIAGTTSATTFKIRMGATGASTTAINGTGVSGLMGGAFNSYLMIKEFAP